MSVPGMILRKFLTVLRCISTCVKRAFGVVFRRRSASSNIGELPYTMPAGDRHAQFDTGAIPTADYSHAAAPASGNWNSWTDETFGIESKIAEYRQQKQQQQSAVAGGAAAATEPDFFNEMQPRLKPTKKLKLRDSNEDAQQSARNLFDVRENDVSLPEAALSSDLGDLDFSATNFAAAAIASRFSQNSDAADHWEDSTLPDDAHLDALAREQRRREREEKHRLRVAEHERRLAEKRQQNNDARAATSAARPPPSLL